MMAIRSRRIFCRGCGCGVFMSVDMPFDDFRWPSIRRGCSPQAIVCLGWEGPKHARRCMHNTPIPRTGVCIVETRCDLTACDHFRWSSTIHIGLIEHYVGAHVCRPGGQHLLLAVNQIAGIERCQLKSMPVRD